MDSKLCRPLLLEFLLSINELDELTGIKQQHSTDQSPILDYDCFSDCWSCDNSCDASCSGFKR